MSEQLSFLDIPAPPMPAPNTPTARELEAVAVAEAMVVVLNDLGEVEAATVARTIVAQCQANLALCRWAVSAIDAQRLAADWPWERETRLQGVQSIERRLATLIDTPCPKCGSSAVGIDRFGRESKDAAIAGGLMYHADYRWRCRECRTKWDEPFGAMRAREWVMRP